MKSVEHMGLVSFGHDFDHLVYYCSSDYKIWPAIICIILPSPAPFKQRNNSRSRGHMTTIMTRLCSVPEVRYYFMALFPPTLPWLTINGLR